MIFNPMLTLWGERGISLKEILSKPAICEKFPRLYVPSVKTMDGQTFIKRDESFYVSANEGEVVRFFWFDKNGKNQTSKDQSFIQVDPNMSGFLVRMHCPVTNVTETGLNVDYIINTDTVQFHEDTNYFIQDGQVCEEDIFLFNPYRMDYDNPVQFDPIITDFDRMRKEIVADYF